MHDIEAALNALEVAVEQAGEGHYGPRRYIDKDQRCIVGDAWYRLGVPSEALRSLGVEKIEDLHKEGILPFPMTLGAVVVYRAAQKAQDANLTWGQALDAAIRTASRYLTLMPTALILKAQEELVTT